MEDSIERIGECEYFVSLEAPAERGKANKALVKLLSKHFGRGVRISKGFASKNKVIEIEE